MITLFIRPIAAILGLSFFGFFGAILGWIGGGLVTTLLRDGPKAILPGGRAEIQKQRQAVFLKTLFLLMGKLAKADSQVSQSEIDHIEKFISQMGMTGEHRSEAVAHFKAGAKPEFEYEATLAHFVKVCGGSLQMRHLLLVYLVGVALADGELHSAERELMLKISMQFGYNERAFDQLLLMIQGQNRFRDQAGGQYEQARGARPTRATNTLAEAHQALGVNAQNSDKEIKRAYRKLISQYHPDKLIGQGVPEDMIAKATERSKEIHAAYELIQGHRKG